MHKKETVHSVCVCTCVDGWGVGGMRGAYDVWVPVRGPGPLPSLGDRGVILAKGKEGD